MMEYWNNGRMKKKKGMVQEWNNRNMVTPFDSFDRAQGDLKWGSGNGFQAGNGFRGRTKLSD